jgi:hypothetical protein
LKGDVCPHNRERVIALFGDSQQFALPATGAEELPIPNQDLKNRNTCKLNSTSNHPPAVGTLNKVWDYVRVIQDKIVKSVKRGLISASIPTPIREESIRILVTCLPLFSKATLNQCLDRGFERPTKAGGIKNRPSAEMRGTPKSLYLEIYTKSRRNVQNSLK